VQQEGLTLSGGEFIVGVAGSVGTDRLLLWNVCRGVAPGASACTGGFVYGVSLSAAFAASLQM
jgi:hypothetical protein